MIEWLVNRIFRWDSLRHAIFDEVRLYQSIDRSMRLKLVIEEMLKDIDMSGEEWNDRDKDGVAYWEKWNKND